MRTFPQLFSFKGVFSFILRNSDDSNCRNYRPHPKCRGRATVLTGVCLSTGEGGKGGGGVLQTRTGYPSFPLPLHPPSHTGVPLPPFPSLPVPWPGLGYAFLPFPSPQPGEGGLLPLVRTGVPLPPPRLPVCLLLSDRRIFVCYVLFQKAVNDNDKHK